MNQSYMYSIKYIYYIDNVFFLKKNICMYIIFIKIFILYFLNNNIQHIS